MSNTEVNEADTITIQGLEFPVSPKYEEGHTLNENEASVLNQTFYENLRNNFAGQVKKAKEENGGEVPTEVHNKLVEDFQTYASEYEFGSRRTSTGSGGDPVEKIAMQLARQAIRDAIRAQEAKTGKKLKDYTSEQIEAGAKNFLNGKGANLREVARQRHAEKQTAASAALEALAA